jgi:hypothetical protein
VRDSGHPDRCAWDIALGLVDNPHFGLPTPNLPLGKGVQETVTLFRIVRASGGGRRAGQRHLTSLVGRDEEISMLMRPWTAHCPSPCRNSKPAARRRFERHIELRFKLARHRG